MFHMTSRHFEPLCCTPRRSERPLPSVSFTSGSFRLNLRSHQTDETFMGTRQEAFLVFQGASKKAATFGKPDGVVVFMK